MHNGPIILTLHLIHWFYQSSGYLRMNVRVVSQAPCPEDALGLLTTRVSRVAQVQHSRSREVRPMVCILKVVVACTEERSDVGMVGVPTRNPSSPR